MKTIIGYILSAAGLALILTSTKIFSLISPLIPGIKLPFIIMGGAGLILIGIIILMNPSEKRSSVSQSSEEVPIYVGEGKHRRIVGYRKQ